MIALKIIATLLACAYPMFEGWVHAILYSRRGDEAYKWNEHAVFVSTRITVGGIMLAGFYGLYSWWSFLGFALCFSFLHNGMYYTQRDSIDGSYPKRWWAMTSDSSAHINESVKFRTTLFILGLLAIAADYVEYLK